MFHNSFYSPNDILHTLQSIYPTRLAYIHSRAVEYYLQSIRQHHHSSDDGSNSSRMGMGQTRHWKCSEGIPIHHPGMICYSSRRLHGRMSETRIFLYIAFKICSMRLKSGDLVGQGSKLTYVECPSNHQETIRKSGRDTFSS